MWIKFLFVLNDLKAVFLFLLCVDASAVIKMPVFIGYISSPQELFLINVCFGLVLPQWQIHLNTHVRQVQINPVKFSPLEADESVWSHVWAAFQRLNHPLFSNWPLL